MRIRPKSEIIEAIANHEKALKQLYVQLQKSPDPDDLKLTEHAKVQYLARVKGIDITNLHAEIITPQLKRIYRTLGDGTYPIADDDIMAVCENGFVITVYRSK